MVTQRKKYFNRQAISTKIKFDECLDLILIDWPFVDVEQS